MAEIKVSSSVLRNSATVILTQATEFSRQTNDILTNMNAIKNQWMGDAANNFITKFQDVSKSFSAYLKTITDYGNFLNKAAADFEVTESQIIQGGNSLPSGSTLYR